MLSCCVDIFRSSYEETNNEDSDIDVSKVEDESNENYLSGNESTEKRTVKWTNCLRNIHMENFTLPVGITFEIGNEARELEVFELFLKMKYSMLFCEKQITILTKDLQAKGLTNGKI